MALPAWAEKDVEGSKDLSIIGRYPGSYIKIYHHADYVETIFPMTTNTMEKQEEFESQVVAGDNKTIVYEIPDAGVSALKVFRTYEKTLKKMGFTQHISCSGDKKACGFALFHQIIKGTDRKNQYSGFGWGYLGGNPRCSNHDTRFLLYTGSLKKEDKEYYLILTVCRWKKITYVLDLLEAQPLGDDDLLTPSVDATPSPAETDKTPEKSVSLNAPVQVPFGFLKVASRTPPSGQDSDGLWFSPTRSSSALTNDAGVEIILDASGSMLNKIAGQRRIDIAKHTLIDLINNVIPADTPFAFRVFGHKEADVCRSDLEIGLSPLNPAGATLAVTGLNAMNNAKTPIGEALAKVSSDMAGITGKRIVILLTDGEETCGGDPAAAIKALRAANTDVRVNIIGFAIDDEALRQTFESGRNWAMAAISAPKMLISCLTP